MRTISGKTTEAGLVCAGDMAGDCGVAAGAVNASAPNAATEATIRFLKVVFMGSL
jgi:hypothetical protein